MNDDTISMSACEQHPPLREWSVKSLIINTCPGCGNGVCPEKTVRELRARPASEKGSYMAGIRCLRHPETNKVIWLEADPVLKLVDRLRCLCIDEHILDAAVDEATDLLRVHRPEAV